MSDIDHDKIITGPLPRGGLVFEFKEMERAVAFATAVKSRTLTSTAGCSMMPKRRRPRTHFSRGSNPRRSSTLTGLFGHTIPVRPSPSGMRGGSSNGKSRNWPRKSSTANLSGPE
jgi:hypothetical protein